MQVPQNTPATRPSHILLAAISRALRCAPFQALSGIHLWPISRDLAALQPSRRRMFGNHLTRDTPTIHSSFSCCTAKSRDFLLELNIENEGLRFTCQRRCWNGLESNTHK